MHHHSVIPKRKLYNPPREGKTLLFYKSKVLKMFFMSSLGHLTLAAALPIKGSIVAEHTVHGDPRRSAKKYKNKQDVLEITYHNSHMP